MVQQTEVVNFEYFGHHSELCIASAVTQWHFYDIKRPLAGSDFFKAKQHVEKSQLYTELKAHLCSVCRRINLSHLLHLSVF